jgi:hypothetical protein
LGKGSVFTMRCDALKGAAADHRGHCFHWNDASASIRTAVREFQSDASR